MQGVVIRALEEKSQAPRRVTVTKAAAAMVRVPGLPFPPRASAVGTTRPSGVEAGGREFAFILWKILRDPCVASIGLGLRLR